MANRPVRGGGLVPMGGGGGGGWIPGHNMPPLGYGVVPQQPPGVGGAMTVPPHLPMAHPATHVTWQHQQQQQQHHHHHQFVASQMSLAGNPVGIQPLPRHQQQQQQPQHFQQYPQHLQHSQQQWMEAQRKAAEDQRKLYDQMMKQRQFDEQKMRLKAFNASKKGDVSADSMIEHILGSKETAKPRLPHQAKKSVESESESQQQSTTQHKQQHGGGALDWTKMDNMNNLFTAKTQGSTTRIPQPGTDLQQPTHSTASPANVTIPGHNNTTTNSPRLPTGQEMVGGGLDKTTPPTPLTDKTAAPPQPPTNKMDGKQPVALPDWLSEPDCQPEVYQRVVSLVAGQEGWVDTSRAHMLLLRTGLTPPLLGLLWEMVNCTQPGHLTQQEFTALLALVAVVQSGQAVTSREVLSGMKEPLLPVIDHPALLPLVQDYIKQRQQQQQQQCEQDISHSVTTNPSDPSHQQTLESAGTPHFNSHKSGKDKNDDDDEEFDDFVSVSGPGDKGGQITSASLPHQPPFLTPPSFPLPQLRPTIVDKMKTMNLPKVGYSPEMSPTTSFDHTGDDDFDDFQSANSTNSSFTGFTSAAEHNTTQPGASSVTPAALPLEPVRSGAPGDKYAVFRELKAPAEELSSFSLGQKQTNSDSGSTNDADESFGDFCSSDAATVVNPSTCSSISTHQPSSTTTTTTTTNTSISSVSSTFPPILPQPTNNGSGTNNTSPISFEIYSTPPEALPEGNADGYFEADFGSAFETAAAAAAAKSPSNYADIHEAVKRAEQEQKQKVESEWNDPFGEFEEGPSVSCSTSSHPPTTAWPVPRLNVECGSTGDDDFGDFMGPGGGDMESGALTTTQQPLGPSEHLAETQSVASLELPGLEVTVGVDCQGAESRQSPDISSRRSDVDVEEQLHGLSLDTPSGGSVGLKTGVGNGQQPSPPLQPQTPVLDTFSGGLVDKYSSIRDEGSKGCSQHDEAHTGSWERCLEGCVGLLKTAEKTLTTLDQTSSLKSQVLATSQMIDYLQDVREVWQVCVRIASSNKQVTTSSKVDQLLGEARSLWDQILAASDGTLVKCEKEEGERSQLGEGEVCGVCLGGGDAGGGRLVYGGHCYHPPCANLWLNCVDLLLPSLTPVTLL
ncbi:hypothetical protein Pcinc_025747 [Petrolisthes cinctipes]|uniref:EH domain-containing protein n=1 Tax=Petrolisthes cinctipes TaxID=88211 RepID=A0AAE1F7A7_PETCI|nr:hypothetical protein Pcinc_025747 [Petrolisthes cinctipes]